MKNLVLYFLISASLIACANQSNNPTAVTVQNNEIKTGGAKLIQVDGKYNVWTKKIGDGKIKVLLLHGGPGFTHDYMECFEVFYQKKALKCIIMIS